jgi:hypothetical protein
MMMLNIRAFGFAAATMAAALFTICAAGVATAPGAMTQLAGFLIHVDMTGFVRNLTWASFFGGVVAWSLGVGLLFASIGALYNLYASPKRYHAPLGTPVPHA